MSSCNIRGSDLQAILALALSKSTRIVHYFAKLVMVSSYFFNSEIWVCVFFKSRNFVFGAVYCVANSVFPTKKNVLPGTESLNAVLRVGKISSALVFHCARHSCCFCWQSRVSNIVVDMLCFAEAGFGQTPNSRVCQRAHVSCGVWLHFRTKVRSRATPITTKSMPNNRKTWTEVGQPYFSPGLHTGV